MLDGSQNSCGCCRTTQLCSRSFGSVGRERAVLEEDMWVHAAMRSWIHEPLIPSRQSSDLISHEALWLLMQQTFSFVRQCCRLPWARCKEQNLHFLARVLKSTHWHEPAPTASREGGRVRNVNGAMRLHLIEKTWVSLIRTACADGSRSDSEKGPACRLEFCFAEQTSRACFVPHG